MVRPVLFCFLFALIVPASVWSCPGDSVQTRVKPKSTRTVELLDSLPHTLRHDNIAKRFYPVIFGAVGLTTYNPNFDGLIALFRKREAEYAAQGIALAKGNMQYEASPLVWLSWGIDFSPFIRFAVEGGFSTVEENRIYAGTLGLSYLPEFAQGRRMQGFVGAGVAAFNGILRVRYGSPLKYGTLDAIEVKAQQAGGYLRSGMDWEMARDLVVEMEVTYYLVSPATSTDYPGSVNFSCLSAGVRIHFNFVGGATP